VLYVGLMLTAGGAKVLEFNCRFGDPETQVILTRLDSDLVDLLDAVVDGRLDEADVRWTSQAAVCVVMASNGYPGKFDSGKVIDGLEAAASLPGVQVFHSATKRVEHLTVTDGGRVLGVTALGSNIADAQRRAYAAVGSIHFDNAYFRRDIASKAF